MESKIKDITFDYGHLLSHTFPGLLFGLEIILAFKLFTPFDGFNFLYSIDYKVTNLIGILIIVFIFSTVIGVILDGVHHFVFSKIEGYDYGYEIYKVIDNIDQFQMFKELVDNDYWYYYEYYANIVIAMFPGIFMLPYWFYLLGINMWFIVIFVVIYVIIFGIMIHQALSTLRKSSEVEEALIENFTKNRKISISKSSE